MFFIYILGIVHHQVFLQFPPEKEDYTTFMYFYNLVIMNLDILFWKLVGPKPAGLRETMRALAITTTMEAVHVLSISNQVKDQIK